MACHLSLPSNSFGCRGAARRLGLRTSDLGLAPSDFGLRTPDSGLSFRRARLKGQHFIVEGLRRARRNGDRGFVLGHDLRFHFRHFYGVHLVDISQLETRDAGLTALGEAIATRSGPESGVGSRSSCPESETHRRSAAPHAPWQFNRRGDIPRPAGGSERSSGAISGAATSSRPAQVALPCRRETSDGLASHCLARARDAGGSGDSDVTMGAGAAQRNFRRRNR